MLVKFSTLLLSIFYLIDLRVSATTTTTAAAVPSSSAPATTKTATVQSTDGAKQAQAASLQQASMLSKALNQIAASDLGDKGSQFLPGYNAKNPECSGDSIDGNWQQIKQQIAQQCIQEKREKRARAQQLAKQLTETKDECVQKVNPAAMLCHTKRELKNIIREGYYELKKMDNITEVVEQNKPILMTITEKYGYNAQEKEEPRQSSFKNSPAVTFKYNRLGGLLSQTGELPQPQKDNPCAICLEAMSKKAESVDGQSENCGGCDSSFDPTMIHSGQFRIQNNAQKDGDKKKSDSAEAA